MGSPVTMRLLQLPPRSNKGIHTHSSSNSLEKFRDQYHNNYIACMCVLEVSDDKPVFEKRPLVWEEDMQMHSKFLDRKVGN